MPSVCACAPRPIRDRTAFDASGATRACASSRARRRGRRAHAWSRTACGCPASAAATRTRAWWRGCRPCPGRTRSTNCLSNWRNRRKRSRPQRTASAAAGARRRHRSAQPGRLPARGRRRRRPCGHRAQGPCGRHQCHGGQGGQRRGRDGALFHGHQPGAHTERAQGAQRSGSSAPATPPEARCTRPICASRWPWCWAPKAAACGS
jgi:hypothetical protein